MMGVESKARARQATYLGGRFRGLLLVAGDDSAVFLDLLLNSSLALQQLFKLVVQSYCTYHRQR